MDTKNEKTLQKHLKMAAESTEKRFLTEIWTQQ